MIFVHFNLALLTNFKNEIAICNMKPENFIKTLFK